MSDALLSLAASIRSIRLSTESVTRGCLKAICSSPLPLTRSSTFTSTMPSRSSSPASALRSRVTASGTLNTLAMGNGALPFALA